MRLAFSVFATGLVVASSFSPSSAIARGKRPTPPPGSIAADVRVVSPQGEESCSPGIAYQAPLTFTGSEGRLTDDLRAVAKTADPLGALAASAKSFVLGDDAQGLALADLSVTGRRSFGAFRTLHEEGALTENAVLAALNGDPELEGLPQPTLLAAAARALTRAYRVANALPYGDSPDRADLGWIAVSGEDDEPYRPVNVPSAEYAQHDLLVTVDGHLVSTRYIIAEGLKDPDPAPSSRSAGRTLPVLPHPALSSDAKVLLFIHGMDSRLEEAMSLIHALRAISRKTGENWTVISMDLPNAGYATQLDHREISPLTDLGHPRHIAGFDSRGQQNVPVLDFMEKFVLEFVRTLDNVLPLKDRIQAVIGGSLGGNLTLRLGRRTDLPWLRNLVSWSPASIWDGLADGGDIFKELGVMTAWNRAGGKTRYLDESADKRAEFFKDAFGGAVNLGPIHIVPPQPDQWYRSDWACFDNARALARLDRQETYSRNFRLWHWRLGAEQLIYSHQRPPHAKEPRYLENRVRMLLATGSKDNFNYTNIYGSTRKTAHRMVNTPGRAILVQNTGHSIHSERPNFLAEQIAEFLH